MSFSLNKLLLVILVTHFITLSAGLATLQDWICWRNGQYNISCDLKCSGGLARPRGCEICQCRESMCSKSDAVNCDNGWHCEVRKIGKAWFPIDATVCVPDETAEESTSLADVTAQSTSIATLEASVSSTSEAATTVKATISISSETTTETTASSTIPPTVPTTTATTTNRPTVPTVTVTTIITPRLTLTTTNATTTTAKRTFTTTTNATTTIAKPTFTTTTNATTTAATTITSTKSERISTSTTVVRNITEIPSTATCEQRGRCDMNGVCHDQDYDCRSDGRCCKRDSSRPETSAIIPRCQQRPDYGYCKFASSNYIYDINTSRCVPIIYGGCGFSDNMFNSKEECSEICEKPCKQVSSEGPCRANIPRYYYNMTLHKCVLFDYGGCQGNENNFKTAEACEIQCRMLYLSDENVFKNIGKTHIIFSRRNNVPGSGSNSSNANNNNNAKNDNLTNNNNDDSTSNTIMHTAKKNAHQNMDFSKNNTGVSSRPFMLPFFG